MTLSIRQVWGTVPEPQAKAWTRAGRLVLLGCSLGSPLSQQARRLGIAPDRLRGAVNGRGVAGASMVWPNRPPVVLLETWEHERIASWVQLCWVQWVLRVAPHLVPDDDEVARMFMAVRA